MHPQYDDCPTICAETGERGFCDMCPRYDLKQSFREASEEHLDAKCPNWQKWGFDNLLEAVLDVRAMENVGGAKTRMVASLINILAYERDKMDRIEAFNRRASAKHI